MTLNEAADLAWSKIPTISKMGKYKLSYHSFKTGFMIGVIEFAKQQAEEREQSPSRTCETCKYFHREFSERDDICTRMGFDEPTKPTNSCARYKQKENAQ